MINENDPVYRKHKDCPVEAYWQTINNQPRIRMRCTLHGKWLHILNSEESQLLAQAAPDLVRS